MLRLFLVVGEGGFARTDLWRFRNYQRSLNDPFYWIAAAELLPLGVFGSGVWVSHPSRAAYETAEDSMPPTRCV
jgi:hypothetical protein